MRVYEGLSILDSTQVEVRARILRYKIILIWSHHITGDISTGESLVLQNAFDAFSPQFTLSCTSTGGPATTVTWMRDSEIVSDGTSTVLEDTETAEYTHTLTVTGRLGGYYQCIVSNNKPSMASSSLVILGETKQTLKYVDAIFP